MSSTSAIRRLFLSQQATGTVNPTVAQQRRTLLDLPFGHGSTQHQHLSPTFSNTLLLPQVIYFYIFN